MPVSEPGVPAPHLGPGVRVHGPLALRRHGPVPADHHEAGVGRDGDGGTHPVTLPGPQLLEYRSPVSAFVILDWRQTGTDQRVTMRCTLDTRGLMRKRNGEICLLAPHLCALAPPALVQAGQHDAVPLVRAVIRLPHLVTIISGHSSLITDHL